ncbi:hypothetical protein ACFE04_025825 [Oxalis oulophora]
MGRPILLHLQQQQQAILGKPVKALWKDDDDDDDDGSFSLSSLGFIQSLITTSTSNNKEEEEIEDPFYLLDLGTVASLYEKWIQTLPMVKPFYAVKCNPDPTLITFMASLGSNFDCASRAEIELVLSLGVKPDRIVYANPCKQESHITYAASVGVNLTTFDSIHELHKITKCHPNSNLLLRLKPPQDSDARCPLDSKYGALPSEIEPLLRAAASHSLVGVSFHIGSAALDSTAFRGAIALAKTTFDTAAKLGFSNLSVLNIGGGFTSGSSFDQAASVVKESLQSYFGHQSAALTVIAEPGRFFAESAFLLAVNIIGKRVRGSLREYFINDGLYGSFNCLLYDHATVTCIPLACKSNSSNPQCKGLKSYQSTVFGPTCDALDTILTNYQLPGLEVNDWLVFPNMGAYTAAAGSSFNGFNTAAISTYLAYSTPA